MSEPSSSVPGEIADAQVEEPSADGAEVETVELDVDEEKMEAWDAIKSDYQVDPDAEGESESTSSESESTSTGGDQGGDGSAAAERDTSQS